MKLRPDTWSDLLEPFLDTEFDEDHQRATAARLRAAGNLRRGSRRHPPPAHPLMHSYNFDSIR